MTATEAARESGQSPSWFPQQKWYRQPAWDKRLVVARMPKSAGEQMSPGQSSKVKGSKERSLWEVAS